MQELKQRSGATCEVSMQIGDICSADEGALPAHAECEPVLPSIWTRMSTEPRLQVLLPVTHKHISM